jgi:DNA polymerase elongation subunit (family B)
MGGKINKINSGLIYKNYDFIFNEFVEYFEKFRNINEENKVLGKLIINSFYGRTGLSIKNDFSFFVNSEKEFNEIIELSEINNIEIDNIEEINNVYLITVKLNSCSRKVLEKKFEYLKRERILNIGVASSIASKARIKLYKGFKEVEKNNGRVLYCDTDSIFAEFKENVLDIRMGDIF